MRTEQGTLFVDAAPPAPREGVWYPIRFLGREQIQSPTQGRMWRLKASVTDGPFAGLVCWKPLTADNLKGIEWSERTLRVCGWKAYHFARLRSRTGIGGYLEGLIEAVTGVTAVEATLYLYHHATEGDFWTLRSVRPSR